MLCRSGGAREILQSTMWSRRVLEPLPLSLLRRAEWPAQDASRQLHRLPDGGDNVPTSRLTLAGPGTCLVPKGSKQVPIPTTENVDIDQRRSQQHQTYCWSHAAAAPAGRTFMLTWKAPLDSAGNLAPPRRLQTFFRSTSCRRCRSSARSPMTRSSRVFASSSRFSRRSGRDPQVGVNFFRQIRRSPH